jgi:hypothetical protein
MHTILDAHQLVSSNATKNPSPAPTSRRLAYLLSRYPAASHSFFLNLAQSV